LIEIGSKTADTNSAQTNRQTDRQTNRHYKNNGHLAVNLYNLLLLLLLHPFGSLFQDNLGKPVPQR